MIIGRRGVGMKTEDKYAVPLCHAHHMELHRGGDEFVFWIEHGEDPIEWAKEAWASWPDYGREKEKAETDDRSS